MFHFSPPYYSSSSLSNSSYHRLNPPNANINQKTNKWTAWEQVATPISDWWKRAPGRFQCCSFKRLPFLDWRHRHVVLNRSRLERRCQTPPEKTRSSKVVPPIESYISWTVSSSSNSRLLFIWLEKNWETFTRLCETQTVCFHLNGSCVYLPFSGTVPEVYQQLFSVDSPFIKDDKRCGGTWRRLKNSWERTSVFVLFNYAGAFRDLNQNAICAEPASADIWGSFSRLIVEIIYVTGSMTLVVWCHSWKSCGIRLKWF